MRESIEELYEELKLIFREHTTYNWKNGWQHEGDRLSKNLTIQKHVEDNNEFLLEYKHKSSFKLQGENFSISVGISAQYSNRFRFDIKHKSKTLYYFITNDKWDINKKFILNICSNVYYSKLIMRESMNISVNSGELNPEFLKKENRDFILENLLN